MFFNFYYTISHHRIEYFLWVDFFGTSQDGASLPCARRAVEKEMGQLVFLDECADGLDDVLVGNEVLQRVGPILLHPGQVRLRLTPALHHLGLRHTENVFRIVSAQHSAGIILQLRREEPQILYLRKVVFLLSYCISEFVIKHFVLH